MQQFRCLDELGNDDICEYMAQVMYELMSGYGRSAAQVRAIVEENIPFLREYFHNYPEMICHDDPIAFAERLAIRWGWQGNPQLTFV